MHLDNANAPVTYYSATRSNSAMLVAIQSQSSSPICRFTFAIPTNKPLLLSHAGALILCNDQTRLRLSLIRDTTSIHRTRVPAAICKQDSLLA